MKCENVTVFFLFGLKFFHDFVFPLSKIVDFSSSRSSNSAYDLHDIKLKVAELLVELKSQRDHSKLGEQEISYIEIFERNTIGKKNEKATKF